MSSVTTFIVVPLLYSCFNMSFHPWLPVFFFIFHCCHFSGISFYFVPAHLCSCVFYFIRLLCLVFHPPSPAFSLHFIVTLLYLFFSSLFVCYFVPVLFARVYFSILWSSAVFRYSFCLDINVCSYLRSVSSFYLCSYIIMFLFCSPAVISSYFDQAVPRYLFCPSFTPVSSSLAVFRLFIFVCLLFLFLFCSPAVISTYFNPRLFLVIHFVHILVHSHLRSLYFFVSFLFVRYFVPVVFTCCYFFIFWSLAAPRYLFWPPFSISSHLRSLYFFFSIFIHLLFCSCGVHPLLCLHRVFLVIHFVQLSVVAFLIFVHH